MRGSPEEIVMSNLTHERKEQVSVGVNATRNNIFACCINDSCSCWWLQQSAGSSAHCCRIPSLPAVLSLNMRS